MTFEKITEKESTHHDLEKMSTNELLLNINKGDKSVPYAVEKAIPEIEKLIDLIVPRIDKGGRIFYIGAGTSGRLGIVDASECPPTFGVPHGMVIGLIAGGDLAIRKAVEFAEDEEDGAWKDLQKYNINENDVVIGIAASGTTPYVIGALKKCKELDILTAGITCNPGSPLATVPRIPIVTVVGPEFVTGSTRMKSGTAQKLVLNMISTSVMIKIGRVEGNRMIDMELSNNKLVDRGTKMIMKKIAISYEDAKELLQKHGSVRKAIKSMQD